MIRLEHPFSTEHLPNEGGAYVLEMQVKQGAVVKVGRLGTVRVGPGLVRYYGSAFGPGGLRARITRHLRAVKKRHWHIDWLLEHLQVVAVEVAPGRRECDLVRRDRDSGSFEAAILGFGSSDCPHCPGHLLVERALSPPKGEPLASMVSTLDGIATPGKALDVACGRGRHLEAMFARGWRVFGIDRNGEALEQALQRVPRANLVNWDVERDGLPATLGSEFDLVVTTFFLFRPLVSAFFSVVRPGGHWFLETFHARNHTEKGHPRRRNFCLGPGEAGRLANSVGFEVVWANEGEHGGIWTTQMLAQRPR